MATVHLIDASPYFFRAWFSVPDTMTTPDGWPVNAVYGFVGFLNRLVREEEPTHIGVAFDQSLTTSFRNDIYPDYKAQRELPPEDLERQQEASRDVARAMGMEVFVDQRYEADDLIATLHAQLRADGHSVVVVSSDKDLGQLVDAETTLFDFAKGDRYGPAEIQAKFGVRPAQIPEFQGLAGDSVDNIPGVAGVGPKTAATLLGAFETLDEVYDGLDRIPELGFRGARTLPAKLAAERERAFLSRRLARLALDAPAAADLALLAFEGADSAAVERVFGALGLAGIGGRVRLRR
ncbi:MAG: 5'-3' exonuclease H3TH domain-containing protein [Planctomycetota bacterium]